MRNVIASDPIPDRTRPMGIQNDSATQISKVEIQSYLDLEKYKGDSPKLPILEKDDPIKSAKSWLEFYETVAPSDDLYRLYLSSELKIDRYGDFLWVLDYTSDLVYNDENWVLSLVKNLDMKGALYRPMNNRGQDPNSNTAKRFGAVPKQALAIENKLKFQIRNDQGLSSGIFTDQRYNRLWAKNHSEDKKVLNLYSYTGAFSVASLAGKAKEVFQVDVSQTYLDWTNEHLKANSSPQDRLKSYKSDCMDFLRFGVKKGFKYDLVFCDPPVFGRSKSGTFKFESDFPELIRLCADSLSPSGLLFFSTNFESWEKSKLDESVKEVAQTHNLKLESLPKPPIHEVFSGSPAILSTWIFKKID
jgi:23S rRNA (cytosine1962-C5)-methyltransferase